MPRGTRKNDGEVLRSRLYEVDVNDQETVYNFVVTLLGTACRSTRRSKVEEIKGFDSLVWEEIDGEQCVANGELEILMEGRETDGRCPCLLKECSLRFIPFRNLFVIPIATYHKL